MVEGFPGLPDYSLMVDLDEKGRSLDAIPYDSFGEHEELVARRQIELSPQVLQVLDDVMDTALEARGVPEVEDRGSLEARGDLGQASMEVAENRQRLFEGQCGDALLVGPAGRLERAAVRAPLRRSEEDHDRVGRSDPALHDIGRRALEVRLI